ncbi:unnamed protein product [Lymnaea stagnalis]|uniref:Uncharacterized protein n=1 Tax=Lymnaea stagnalis TaxID=6523 RepID=A0AAV2HHA6_LYMST
MRSPLHTAALHGKTDTVLYLVQHCGYKPDERDSCGVTPLMDALRAGHLDAANFLIDYHKADVSLEDKVGRQPIHLVAQSGQVLALEFIVSLGLSVNVRSSGKGETPLHLAAKEGHDNMALKLLQTGAEIDAQDTTGRTALHYATAAQHGDMITVLHSYSAKSLKDNCGRLPENLSSREIVKDSCMTKFTPGVQTEAPNLLF